MYELLTLHPALRGQSPPELLQQLEHGNPYPPRTWNPAIPFDLETILLKAIAKSRDERYGSAREFADDLRRFLEGRPVVARRPTLLDRSAKWARRHQLSVAGGIGAAVLAMAALLVNTAIVTQQRQLRRTRLESGP